MNFKKLLSLFLAVLLLCGALAAFTACDNTEGGSELQDKIDDLKSQVNGLAAALSTFDDKDTDAFADLNQQLSALAANVSSLSKL